MAVIIADSANASYNGNLSTANGFYRVEANNLGLNSATSLSLGTTRTIAVTFANAGNCQGVVLIPMIMSSEILTSSMKSITVKLQENTGSWVDRATVTYTAAQLANGTLIVNGSWIVPFVFATPYAVTTAAATWRFEVSNATGTNNWSIRTSDGTNPFYATWCDNKVSFTANDTIIVKNALTIDQTASVKGTLGTGDSVRAPAIVVCKHPTSGDAANVALLTWGTGGSYTLTVDGFIALGAHSGFRAGTSVSRISIANKGLIDFITPTVGTTTSFQAVSAVDVGEDDKMSIFIYGEVPTNRSAILNADAAAGQKNIVLTTSPGWAPGDTIVIGGNKSTSTNDVTVYIINTISGPNIGTTLNLNIAKAATGHVYNVGGYGFTVNVASPTDAYLRTPNNFQVSGCSFKNARWRLARTVNQSFTDGSSANAQLAALIDQCAFWMTGGAITYFLIQCYIPTSGITINSNHCIGNLVHNQFSPMTSASVYFQTSGNITYTNNIVICQAAPNDVFTTNSIVTGNFFEGNTPGVNYVFRIEGGNITATGNTFLYCSTCIVIYHSMACTLGSNVFNGCDVCYDIAGVIYDVISTSDTFANLVVNVNAVRFGQNAIFTAVPCFDVLFESPIGTFVQSTGIATTSTSILRITNAGGTVNNDQCYLTKGNTQRTGTGLTDTTVRTAGGYALRIQPTSGTTVINWPNLISQRAVPTGNIQNMTMTVSVWVNINSSAYSGGTYVYPTLNVKYDNTTTMTAVSTGVFSSWQQLAVTFTPATTYGQIEVWVSGATDASGADAYFYVDDFNVAYPAGVQVNLGPMDLFAKALPVWPPISTFPSLGGVWDESTSAHTVAGTFGTKVKKLLELGQFIGLK